MDYRLNNEALVACVITEILYRKPVDMLQLSIVITYLISDNKDRCFGDNYKECLPVVLNASLILKECGSIRVREGIVELSNEGIGLRKHFSHFTSKRFAAIVNKLNQYQSYLLDSTNSQLIESFNLFITP